MTVKIVVPTCGSLLATRCLRQASAAASAAPTTPPPKRQPGGAGGLGVVRERPRPRQRPGGGRRPVGAQPGSVDVGGGVGGPVLDDARKGAPAPAGASRESRGQPRQHA